MGKGFMILVWDSFGSGLVMVNARMLSRGKDIYGNPTNWWSYKSEEEKESKIKELTEGIENFKVIED